MLDHNFGAQCLERKVKTTNNNKMKIASKGNF